MSPKRARPGASDEVDNLTAVQLRKKAKEQGVVTTGSKQDLITRLKACAKKRPAPKAAAEPAAKRGRKSHEEVKPAEAAAAQELKAALGLSAAAARRLAALLQTLSKTELCRRLKILQSPPARSKEPRRGRLGRLAAPGPAMGGPGPAPGALFGLPADSGRTALSCLNLADHNSVRAVCHGARSLVDFEICRLAAGFTYKAELFDARRVTCTRSGRVMSNGDSGRSRRFLGFLTRHAKLLQQLDVRHAPIDALESKILRLAIPCMQHLTEIVLPTEGWSSHADRQRLLSAIPRSVIVKWSKFKEFRSKTKPEPAEPSNESQPKLQNSDQPVAA
eukprot:s52_g37.t1